MKDYIENGRVAREEIAYDVCDGTLTKEDIKKLVKNEKIKEAFIGNTFSKKISEDNWSDKYLEKLPNYAIAESFNEDYLYYAADVYEKVSKKKSINFNGFIRFVKRNWGWIAFVVVVIVAIVVYAAKSSN